ncbi:hypothetical protein FRB90_009536, partial [Tulasnella sp. 427]
MAEVFNRVDIDRLADEVTAQAFGVGVDELSSFMTRNGQGHEERETLQALDSLLRRLFEHRNRLLRLEVLPDEILLDIFKLAIEFDKFNGTNPDISLQDEMAEHYWQIYQLQMVQKKWRDIIVSFALSGLCWHSDKGSVAGLGTPTPRWLYIDTSDVLQMPSLYVWVEELLIESPTSLLVASDLQMSFESAPNLRKIRFDQMDETELEDPDVAADEPRVVAPSLKLLEILNSDREQILWVLNRFQLSPSTSLKIQTWNYDIDDYEDKVRAHVHAILRSTTDSSISLDISTWSYKLQT